MAQPAPVRPEHTNRLLGETSPYLLQHAHNPVDWFPWGAEALSKAKAEQKPIFLSIGYSACHWCHVMERESFEDKETAAFMNAHFVNIKVDREEHPDLDTIYMAAVMALNGSGGWPMSIFLTPKLEPFYGGTYFPPEDRYGYPGFPTLLSRVAQIWEEDRGHILENARGLTAHITASLAPEPGDDGPLTPALLTQAVRELERSFDPQGGGWGTAPKFPSSAAIGLLLREYQRTGEDKLLQMATVTLDHMADGGLYDHLGGGFHRYAVDPAWLVPHFEKMLYDNAQLAQVYLEAYQLTGNTAYRRVAEATFDYVLRDLRDARGGFHASEDADSEGQEGTFYLWTRAQVIDVLGPQDAALFCTYYGVRDEGNFPSHEPHHRDQNILHVAQPRETTAQEYGLSPDELERKMSSLRAKMLEARAQRVRPGLDDKVLTSWNALMITALAQGAQILGAPRYRQAAEEAGRFLLEHMMQDEKLLRSHRNGQSRLPGYLDDYAFTANAFVDLYEATFDVAWIDAADRLAGEMHTRFWDGAAGNFYFTAPEHTGLIVRTKPANDGAEPSGNSVAALALLRLAVLLDKPAYRDQARRTLESNQPMIKRAPRAFLAMLRTVDFLVHPPKEIVLAGYPESSDTRRLLDALHSRFVPNKVVAVLDPAARAPEKRIPLLAVKTLLDGKAAAYVCRNFACRTPVNTPEGLLEQLGDTPA